MLTLIKPKLNEHEIQLLLQEIEVSYNETHVVKLNYTSPKVLYKSLSENSPKEQDTLTICICESDEEIPLSIIRKVDFFISRPVTEKQMTEVIKQVKEQKIKDLIYSEYCLKKEKGDVIRYPQPGRRRDLIIRFKELLWLEADNTVTIFYLKIKGKSVTKRGTVKFSDCLKELPQQDFFETYRGIAVQRSALANTNNRKIKGLKLKDGRAIKLARRRTKEFWNWWNN